MRARLCVAAVAAAPALLITACSAAASPAPIAGTPAPFTFTGTVKLSGEVTVQGPFTDALTLRHETCEQYVRAAAPATTLWVVPTPTTAQLISGHALSYTAGVPDVPPSSGYRGPGAYSGASASVSVLIVDNASFISGDHTSALISVKADGSGTLSFSGMVDTSTGESESGSVQWSCTD